MIGFTPPRRHLFATALLCSSAIIPFTATMAQAQDEQPKARVMDEIIVTSTRRETSVSDVPYNITAVSGSAIERAQIFDDAELLRSIPGVGVIDRGARNSGTLNQVRIRGLNVDGSGLGDYAVSSVASVSTYLNETPIFGNFLLRDLERVEVLRGPQGTLYGSGSLGGTIRYMTRKPVLGETSGMVSSSLSSVKNSESIGYSLDGVLNLPLGEDAALRIVGSYGDYPGITDYVNVYDLDANGIPVAPNGVLDPAASYSAVEDADTVDQWMGRATLLWEPSDTVDLTLMHIRQSDDVGGRRQNTFNQDGFGNAYGEGENGSIQLEPSTRDINSTSLEVNVDLGFATLTSSTSHYDHTGDSTSENTGFYAQAGFLGFYYNYPRPMASAVRSYADEAIVQEIRLVSNVGETFDYVVGGFYRKQQIESTQESYLLGFKQWWDTLLPGLSGLVTGDKDFDYRRVENFEEVAAFGEVTYHATDTLDLTVGARYFDNKSENDTFIDLPLYAGVFTPTNASFETSEDDILFKGNVSWRYNDDAMIYATVSEGYRRGGSNAVPLTGTFAEDPGWQVYTADSVVNYEIGTKGSKNGLTYDVSAFYIDWTDPQLNTATTNWGFFAVQNGSKARTLGVEASLDGYFGDSWHYNLGYAYVDAELSDDFFAPNNSVTPVAVDGARLPGAPEHMLNWALDYSAPLNDQWDFFARVDGSYQSETRNGVGVSPTFNVPLEGFSLWNATTSVTRGNFTGSLWVKNIFDEAGVTGVFTEAYMGTSPSEGYFGNANKELISLPRTIGLTGSYGF
ncbi:TonB-dependent receptor [Algimonas arctica]|uniref:TonB-dependent receptor n=1 Tax=Algimonas arctica TaxID=1479486 RepID=A0A8J3CQS6_9PROT|nr:TonB-dependent receptor [Algimonas arctica]GHA97945.1 TonB-dependent receptor [Algimonas arctica]